MTPGMDSQYDVIVIGGGNSGLCAALSAREHGGSVLLIEKAPREDRGGNTKYTGFFRFTYNGLADILPLAPDITEDERRRVELPPYSADMYYNDIMRITGGRADPELTTILVNSSRPALNWLAKWGLKSELLYDMVIRLGEKLYWEPGVCIRPKGGGKGLVDALFSIVEAEGVTIAYEVTARQLLCDNTGRISGVLVKTKDGLKEIAARKGVVLACGGFEASPEMRAKYLGAGWDIVKVRGTKYNTGEGITMALELGAKTSGEWTAPHATQVDAGAPEHDHGSETFRESYQNGILLNTNGDRFLDEGEDFSLYTYAKFGRIVLRQPNALAYQIYDQKVKSLLTSDYNIGTPPVVADTLEELAEGLGIDSTKLVKTVTDFNKAVQEGEFSPAKLDGKKTVGIEPPKSNWALRIDAPPFLAYPVTGGITFTFGGLAINGNAQVLDTTDNPIEGLYAVGETHGYYYHNYPGASGLMRGSVFGRIAGAHAMGHQVIN
ncbi:MAG: FAD-dependent tricarballylate dehydrogenase TcuA [Chloroflexi bacterium]|nr:FAD-dependent tricarballylate dehydrogenase TcuA [Chloroflexota bacterium]